MARVRSVFRRLLGLAGAAVCLWQVSVAAGQVRLEYRLEAGDRLVYERRAVVSSLATGEKLQKFVDQIQLWCLDKTGETAFILLDLIHMVDGQVEPMRGVVLHVDRYGRRQMPQVTQVRVSELEAAFDVLPVQCSPLQDAAAWKTPTDLFGRQERCTLSSPDEVRAGHVRVDTVREYLPGVGDVLGRSRTGRYWFDAEAGVVTRVELLEQDQAAGLRTEAVTVLRRRERKPMGWIGRRAAEAPRYVQALQYEDRLLAEIVQQPDKVAEKLEHLDRLWAGWDADFQGDATSPFAILGRARRKHLRIQSGKLHADARYAGRWLGRIALPWSLQNASGRTVTSEQLRGSVAVECLWSTDAPRAVATLELMRGLQEQLADKPVQVICLNMDGDAHLAQRVIERFRPGLTHVLAGPLRAVQPPPRLPIVRVLDRDGVIRGLWIGWHPSCAGALEEALRWAE